MELQVELNPFTLLGNFNNYLTSLDHFAREAIDAFDKADRAHRLITGRGLL